MKTGKRWSTWKASLAAAVLTLNAAGCLTDRAQIEKSLKTPSTHGEEVVAQTYRIACPDIIALTIPKRPEFDGRYQIGADGRINLGDYGNPRIEGRLLNEAAGVIAAEVGVTAAEVQVRIVEFRSQHILLFGEVAGRQHSVPYRGQETVFELLQRVGGITPGAAPEDVYLVRPHLGDNRRPEIFRIDLAAIALRHDPRTNIRVLPFDQIYVGESRAAKVENAVPPWLRWMTEGPEARGQETGVRSQETGARGQEGGALK